MVDFAVAGSTPSPEVRPSFPARRGPPRCTASRSGRGSPARWPSPTCRRAGWGCRPPPRRRAGASGCGPALPPFRRRISSSPAPFSTTAAGSNEYSVPTTLQRLPGAQRGGAALTAGFLLLPAAQSQDHGQQQEQGGWRPHGDGILCAAVTRPAALLCLAALAILAGCGGEIEVPEEQTSLHRGRRDLQRALLRLPLAGRRQRLRQQGRRPAGGRRGHERAELQRPQGEQGRRALRDPQRRLLRADHARQHRGRAGTPSWWRTSSPSTPARRAAART